MHILLCFLEAAVESFVSYLDFLVDVILLIEVLVCQPGEKALLSCHSHDLVLEFTSSLCL